MNKRSLFFVPVLALIGVVVVSTVPLAAEEDVTELKAQIEALQKRVDELEQEKKQQERNDPWDLFNRPQNRAWDPFYEMERMQEEMNRMFSHSFGRSGLNRGIFMNDMSFDYNFDIKEEDDRYEIIFDMTGLDENKLDIEIKEDSITVKGHRTSEEIEENDNSHFRAKSYGSFLKTIPVPEDADTAQAKTEKKDNKLIIILPKKVT